MNAALSPEKNSNFAVGFLFLSKPQREALQAVYRFCRHVDDIADSGHLSSAQAQRMLDFWREEIERLYRGCPTHSISMRLAAPIERFHLPSRAFSDLISGVELDLRKNRYATYSELEAYLYGVAVTVGLLCIEIFGYAHTPAERAREYARQLGTAFQLTNILRDVGADLEKGRIYIPLDEMAQAGYREEDLLRREHSPALEAVLARQYERAKLCYRRARNVLDAQDRVSMMPAEAMARVYESILENIRAEGYRVFFRRPSVSTLSKVRLAASAWAYCHGIV
ncbi:MAG: presqualene diphosphate synthase HpnD [Elusimicrobia bacterium]|nr:presqualene diphosphate synthase HpnD [Elusimicrobiota bacterium]